ncbi:hypothetical protein COZ83_02060 [Candidatus Kaiserbacteria bacterium CG_4_8_14_3_um_filter_50_23]|uniref:N-acetyltransferase domain-containing protein n=2 Tax=Candidatus Kaiseribacteriota TaxID=1752734 RepID=A0A2M7FE05_9BACT|nr:MAG: hypothetical protein AUJ45_01345 [Parcubacteria group bacterium CG1_02_50_68]PIS43322.1 MAG: hypothetical protein COT23_02005 [Candidatus Kaiserbacteria bacterium CG08_land_8_20_14_0_20_50_21]PIU82109.1 MAG: hypothetical protein COS69_01025 [Candidatus Kaiserbacteria bacterium CG06_land_8_20_14_3_00_49_31]PIV87251.1 MAG: hypothetical protein COW49_00590 [Candidatus Kaiserbacteria bacterium CG17_big_fil_post_rev_8_21_14_2_50_51_7]PIW96196.1 MAG: hypothetical protein COZ83_02060 [Candidat
MFNSPPGPENLKSKKESIDARIAFLEKYGAKVELDKPTVDAYRLTFSYEDAVVTIRIALNDYGGADVIITNMTTLPDSQKDMGFGSKALQSVLSWAANNFKDIRAVQVQEPSENFWIKNGFTKCEDPNPTNDFIYRTSAK